MRFHYVLAGALLSLSLSAIASPIEKSAEARTEQLRLAGLERSHFPASLDIKGKRFVRLTGPALASAISGKTICLGRCSHIAGNVHVYYQDGAYAEFGDRWEGYGTYIISRDVVLSELEGHVFRRAFYKSSEGLLAQAIETRNGAIVAGEVVVED